eukprot:6496644-Alexandrium_andersonii.AAC.1
MEGRGSRRELRAAGESDSWFAVRIASVVCDRAHGTERCGLTSRRARAWQHSQASFRRELRM